MGRNVSARNLMFCPQYLNVLTLFFSFSCLQCSFCFISHSLFTYLFFQCQVLPFAQRISSFYLNFLSVLCCPQSCPQFVQLILVFHLFSLPSCILLISFAFHSLPYCFHLVWQLFYLNVVFIYCCFSVLLRFTSCSFFPFASIHLVESVEINLCV